MLLTVTPNPCIERTVQLLSFAPGAVHRVLPENLLVNAGGKGINAARVAVRFGCETVATGWIGRRQMEWFAEQMTAEGVAHDLVAVEADTRVCTNVLEEGAQGWRKSEIVEAGQPLEVADGTRMLEKFAQLLPAADLVAICGSYPPAREAAMEQHLAVMTTMARRAGKRVLVDGKGRTFSLVCRRAVAPWAVKPNLEEAAELLHRAIITPADERKAVRDILKRGIEVVILSCGARGAYLGTAEGIWFFTAPEVEEISPVGSGDALVGAFCAKFLETGDLREATRWGVAAGAANAAQAASAFIGPADVEPLVGLVKVAVAELALGG